MSAEPFLPTRAPIADRETATFWEGCAAGRLMIPRCDGCGELIWYPRGFCPWCASTSTTWTEMSGRGIIYSFTISRRGMGSFADVGPYVPAFVELEEGPRLLTNIVGCDAEILEIGQAVSVVFEPAGTGPDGRALAIPRFRPA